MGETGRVPADAARDAATDAQADTHAGRHEELEQQEYVLGSVVDDAAVVSVVADAENRKPGARLLSMLILVGGLEGADGVLLPCVFYALQQDLGLTLNNLAMMSMVQALAGNFAAPAWGVMADRGTLRRKTIIVLGCIVQGLITVILAGVDHLWPMVVLRALNGVMLASLRPIANGVVADVTSETNRGKVYAGMGVAMNIGTMGGTLIGTNLGRQTVVGIQGWRVAFVIVGAASVLVGFVAWAVMEEPPKTTRGGASKKGRCCGAFRAEFWELASYFRMPSFCVLILQGCFGSVPWNALGYKTLFFQLGGVTDAQAALIDVFSQIAGSLGNLLGGVVGDSMSKCSKNHGRPITAQISVLAGIPVAWFLFMAQPPDGAFAYYAILMIVLGLTATWCAVGVNLPILAEIVKDDRRATIMAWEGTLESSCSAVFGNAMVGILAQDVFGYDLANANADATKGASSENTRALGSALMLVSLFPWVLCFACYTLLHWSYPRDLRWLQEREMRAKGAAAGVELQVAPDSGAARSPAGKAAAGDAAEDGEAPKFV